MEKFVKILRAVTKKSAYILVNFLIFFFAFLFIFKGYHSSNTDQRNAIYLSIGSSLAAAGIVALVYLWKELLKSKVLEKVSNVIFDAGIDHIYPKRDLDQYDSLMSNLTSKLDITGYTLNAFYESYAEILEEKLKSNPALNIRMLVVNPDSDFAKSRAELEEKKQDSFKDSINRIKNRFEKFSNSELRCINSPLTTMIFRVDTVMFIGPHFYKKSSKSTLTFELNQNGWLFDEYEKEFARLWNGAIKV